MNTWAARYSRHGSQSDHEFDTSGKAWSFLEHGADDGELYPISIISPDGLEFIHPGRGEASVSQKFWEKLKKNEVFIPRDDGLTLDGKQFAMTYEDEQVTLGVET